MRDKIKRRKDSYEKYRFWFYEIIFIWFTLSGIFRICLCRFTDFSNLDQYEAEKRKKNRMENLQSFTKHFRMMLKLEVEIVFVESINFGDGSKKWKKCVTQSSSLNEI